MHMLSSFSVFELVYCPTTLFGTPVPGKVVAEGIPIWCDQSFCTTEGKLPSRPDIEGTNEC
jgi:hypothetical protein